MTTLIQRLRQMADHTGLDAVAELLREAATDLEHSSDHPEHHLEMVPAAQPLERAKQIWREDQERIAALQASIDRLHIENKALKDAVKKIHAAKGRYHTQIAAAELYELCGLTFERPKK